MRPERSAARAICWALIALGLLLPVATLIPLGSLWLWQNGWLLPWAIVACLSTVAAYAVSRWLLKPLPQIETAAPVSPGDPGWTPAEAAAWTRVTAIADTASLETIKTREGALDLGLETVRAVAATLKPGKSDPVLAFTAPEALALIERVATRMRTFIDDNVPLGDRVSIAQMRTLYEWKGSIELAEKAYDVWRAIRFLNPATAIASEVRERLSKEMMAWGKDYLGKRLAGVYVEEVGRAAIDLYGGRLRVSPERLAETISTASARDLVHKDDTAAEPLRVLVAGQISAGKSSLVNALGQEVRAAVDALPATRDFTPYSLSRDGLPGALITDSPGLVSATDLHERLLAAADASDLIVWVAAANRADREPDRAMLARITAHFTARPDRRPPPVLVVLTHIDRLRPFGEWAPPYDLVAASTPKSVSIRDAVGAASADLGVPEADIVPVSLSSTAEPYNVDAVWARIFEFLPEAQRARLVRVLRDSGDGWDWQKLWSQVKSGGRVIAKGVIR